MHIILGLLGLIVTILILVNRLRANGIDIGWLNPFLWKRRRTWKKKYDTNPIYAIETPIEAIALILVIIAQVDGDITADKKQALLQIFKKDFNLNEKESFSLLSSSIFLLNLNVREDKINFNKILAPSLNKFTQEQAESSLVLFDKVVNSLDSSSDEKERLLKQLNAIMKSYSQEID